jgi:hypothetical protein
VPNIITSKTRAARKWYRGSNMRNVEEAAHEAALKPHATRKQIEHEIRRVAVGVPAKRYGEALERGMRQLVKDHLTPPEGVTIKDRINDAEGNGKDGSETQAQKGRG